MLRFDGFELDPRRLELREAGGQVVPLRRKSFQLLWLFASRSREVLTREEITAAIWPNLHVGQDSLYQCIREIRIALGDEGHARLKVIQGRGYLFDVAVECAAPDETAASPATEHAAAPAGPSLASGRASRPAFWAAGAAGLALTGLVAWALAPSQASAPSLTVDAFSVATDAPETVVLARALGDGLSDGLSRIPGVRLLAQRQGGPAAPLRPQPDFVVSGALQQGEAGWTVRARLVRRASDEVVWSMEASLPAAEPAAVAAPLTAAVGYPLAERLHAALHLRGKDARARVAVEQARATIVRASRERYEVAQTILEQALTERPNDADLKAALAAQLVRGIQTNWTPAEARPAAAERARKLIGEAQRTEPGHLAAQQGLCRLATATNAFAEALVGCAAALDYNPWDGTSLYQLGLTQLQLGRYDDALATFRQAERGDQPALSRWTWLLGAGWALLTLDRPEESVSYVERSLAQTVGTGRSHFALALGLHRLGRQVEARRAAAAGMALRPGSTASNISLPTRGASPSFAAHVTQTLAVLVELGVPPGETPPAELSQARGGAEEAPVRR
jgi:DNA-binding winged helix-turn-helix (wHTH) protein/tetratricopeptide (TPR) repeat protein